MQLSILIRNLNEANQLEQTLLALRKQQVDFEYEVIVIDNESDDNSVEIAKKFGCIVSSLKRSEFTFGHSLNFGLESCKGEIVLILSAHVLLLNEFFLQKIPSYFQNEEVAGLRFTHAVSLSQVSEAINKEAQQLRYDNAPDFANRHWGHLIVNHCSAIRKAAWELEKFDDNLFASEDKMWGLNILRKGYLLLYNVPGFYLYTKETSREQKINRQAIEIVAKQMIAGNNGSIFSLPYFTSMYKKGLLEIRRFYHQLTIHSKIYREVKKLENAKKILPNKKL